MQGGSHNVRMGHAASLPAWRHPHLGPELVLRVLSPQQATLQDLGQKVHQVISWQPQRHYLRGHGGGHVA